MRRQHVCWLLPASFALATATAAAQGTPGSQAPRPAADPLDATAKVSPLVYRSALTTYKRLGDIEPLPWREANDRVGRIGGWRAYAREAQAPEAPASTTPAPRPAAESASAPMSKPMPAPHGGQPKH